MCIQVAEKTQYAASPSFYFAPEARKALLHCPLIVAAFLCFRISGSLKCQCAVAISVFGVQQPAQQARPASPEADS